MEITSSQKSKCSLPATGRDGAGREMGEEERERNAGRAKEGGKKFSAKNRDGASEGKGQPGGKESLE